MKFISCLDIGLVMIGLLGLTSKCLGTERSGIQCPSVTSLACFGVSGEGSILMLISVKLYLSTQ